MTVIADLIQAANGSVPAGRLKPRNCHEAVLGWLIQAQNRDNIEPGPECVEHAWTTLRQLAERHGSSDEQLTGRWMSLNLYRGNADRITRNMTLMLSPGDVVFFGNRDNPSHSMLVVAQRLEQRLARGFNNASAFGGTSPSAWDPLLRDLADKGRWTRDGAEFMTNAGGVKLWRMRAQAVLGNLASVD